MSRQRTRQFRFVIFTILPVILALAAIAPAFLLSGDEARGLDATEWEKVRNVLDKYLKQSGSEFQYGAEGEAGFVIAPADVKSRVDSNGDMTVLGEGDDAANAPILVDTLAGNSTWIPGTAVRGIWNDTALKADTVNLIKDEVNQHEAAEFSTDVVVYCATGHTESPTTGGYGAVAQAGGLGGSTPPKVYAFKWGRNGWTNTSKSYSNEGAMGAGGATSSYANASNSQCGGKTPDSELVRCQAEWAISAGGGNVSNGVNPTGPPTSPPTLGNVQPIDIRTPGPATTINNTAGGNPSTLQIPVETIFNTGLNKLDPTAAPKKIFFGRTQHVAGIVAMGAEMLGYDSGFLQWGLPNWNKNEQEPWAGSGASYSLASNPIDTAAPVLSDITAAPETTSAKIIWNTNEPATSVVEYGTTSGGPYTKVTTGCAKDGNNEPCTVLRGSHNVTLAGLSENTTYYYKVTSYDGLANGATSSEGSFKTIIEDITPPSITNISGDDYTIKANYSDPASPSFSSGVDTTSVVVKVDGQPAEGSIAECWAIGSPSGSITCSTPRGLSNSSHTVEVSITDNAGNPSSRSGSFSITGVRELLTGSDRIGPVTSPYNSISGTALGSIGWQKADFAVALACRDKLAAKSEPESLGSGCKQTYYKDDKVDGGAEKTGNAMKIQSEGDHLLTYRSVDNKGNWEGWQTANAKLDKTLPVIDSISPANGSRIIGDSATIAVYYSDSLSGVDFNSSDTQVKLDGTPMSGCTKTEASMSCQAMELAPDSYKIDATVKDLAGNIVAGTSSFTVGLPGSEGSSYSWYDYGNANTGLFFFDPASGLAPLPRWSSGWGGWELWRSKPVTIGDENGDGQPELAVLYDYGNANTGVFLFESSESGFTPKRKWLSGPGGWEWSRSKVTAGDLNGDGKLEAVVFYDYGNANTGVFSFDLATGAPSRKWLSGPGGWELSRSKLASSYGSGKMVVFYDYGKANTGLFLFDPMPSRKWLSGPGGWDWARTMLTN